MDGAVSSRAEVRLHNGKRHRLHLRPSRALPYVCTIQSRCISELRQCSDRQRSSYRLTLRSFPAHGLSSVQCHSLFRNLVPLPSHVPIGRLHFGIGRDQGGALALQCLVSACFRSLSHFSAVGNLEGNPLSARGALFFHHIEIVTCWPVNAARSLR
jgi:hypothetical protein